MKLHLQGIGEREAIPACDVIVGDIMICNYGETQKVVGVRMHPSGKSVYLDIDCNGKIFQNCRYKSKRAVAVERVNVV